MARCDSSTGLVFSLGIYKNWEVVNLLNTIFSVEKNCISLNTISGDCFFGQDPGIEDESLLGFHETFWRQNVVNRPAR